MELQHVKEIILRRDEKLKRNSSSEEPSAGNNWQLDLTGLVESIGKKQLNYMAAKRNEC